MRYDSKLKVGRYCGVLRDFMRASCEPHFNALPNSGYKTISKYFAEISIF
jgi:hypothetical protein